MNDNSYLLRGAPEKFDICPKCHIFPFSSKILRGLVQRKPWKAPIEWVFSVLKKKPFSNYAIVCDNCSFVVGHESVPDPHHGCQVWCPACDSELVQNGTLIEDADFVTYCCSCCECYSVWDFDAPVPLLLTSGRILSIPRKK